MGPQPSTVEPTQVSESAYNQQSVNNIPVREGSPEYMLASADGTEVITQRSGKKRRRCEMIRRNNLYMLIVFVKIVVNYLIHEYLIFFREKHKRYSPDPITGIKQRKRKHKRKSLDLENPEVQSQPEVHRRITIKVSIFPLYFIAALI